MDVTATVQPTIDPLPPPKAVNKKGEELPSDEVKSRPAPVFAPTREAPSSGNDAPPDMSSLANDNMLPGLSTAVSADDSPSLKQQCVPCARIFPIVADGVHQPSSASSNTAAISESGAPHPNANNNETSSILSSHSSEDSAMNKIHPHTGAEASWSGQISPPVVRHLARMVHNTTIAEATVAPKCTIPEDLERETEKHIHGMATASVLSVRTNAESKAEENASQAKKREAEEVAGEEAEHPIKKRKKAKDPNAPVRPKTAYMFYSCNGARTAVKKAYPDLTFGEVTKVVAADWNAMSDEKKAVWNRMAADDKARYQRDMDAYHKSLNFITPEEAKLLEEAVQNTEVEMGARVDSPQHAARMTSASPNQRGTPSPLLEYHPPGVSNAPIEADDVHQPSATSNAAVISESGVPLPNANNDTSRLKDKAKAQRDELPHVHVSTKQGYNYGQRGVTMRPSGKWQVQYYYCGQSRYIGVFDSKEIAHAAYETTREILGKEISFNREDKEAISARINVAREAVGKRKISVDVKKKEAKRRTAAKKKTSGSSSGHPQQHEKLEARGDCPQYGAPLTSVSHKQSGTPHPSIAPGAVAFPLPPPWHFPMPGMPGPYPQPQAGEYPPPRPHLPPNPGAFPSPNTGVTTSSPEGSRNDVGNFEERVSSTNGNPPSFFPASASMPPPPYIPPPMGYHPSYATFWTSTLPFTSFS
ncbi:hypothetical protein ACHAWC_011934 [Mediolabrus comicus]